jgi:hypothetical protein
MLKRPFFCFVSTRLDVVAMLWFLLYRYPDRSLAEMLYLPQHTGTQELVVSFQFVARLQFIVIWRFNSTSHNLSSLNSIAGSQINTGPAVDKEHTQRLIECLKSLQLQFLTFIALCRYFKRFVVLHLWFLVLECKYWYKKMTQIFWCECMLLMCNTVKDWEWCITLKTSQVLKSHRSPIFQKLRNEHAFLKLCMECSGTWEWLSSKDPNYYVMMSVDQVSKRCFQVFNSERS